MSATGASSDPATSVRPELVRSRDQVNRLSNLAETRQISESRVVEKALDVFFSLTELFDPDLIARHCIDCRSHPFSASGTTIQKPPTTIGESSMTFQRGDVVLVPVPESQLIDQIIRNALAEDIGDGDVTTLNTVPETALLSGVFLAKEVGVVAGLEVVRRVFHQVDPRVVFTPLAADGDRIELRQIIGTVDGPGRAILTGERVALNSCSACRALRR